MAGASVAPPPGEPNPRDPYESVNRRMFAFNEAVEPLLAAPSERVELKLLHRYVKV